MKKNNKGFSLVELIVVIAIMAILAAVAVIGVSVYIPKAQQASDKQLVSDIEYALNLSMQTGEIKDHPIGKLVLSQGEIVFYGTNGQVTDLTGTDVEKVLIASFGTGYKNELKLKYDSWTAGSAMVNGVHYLEASTVMNSSFMTGNRADQLLQDVEIFTDMAANLAGAIDSSLGSEHTLVSLYGEDLLTKTAKQYGILDDISASYRKDGTADGDVDWDKWSKDNKQEFSNLLVFAAAVDNQDKKADSNHQTSAATELIDSFTTYYAFASTCPEFSVVLDEYLAAMNSTTPTTTQHAKVQVTLQPVDSASTGSAWYNALNNELTQGGYKNAADLTYSEYIQKGTDDQGQSTPSASDYDNAAFKAMLSSLGNVSADELGSLDSANLFTQGAVKDQYDQYLNTLNLLNGFGGDFNVTDGQIAIIYNQNTIVVANSIDQ